SQSAPTGYGVDFEYVLFAGLRGQYVNAGDDCAHRRCGVACHPGQLFGHANRFGHRAAADVRPPVQRVAAPHAEDLFAQHEQSPDVAFMRDELLDVEHRTELDEQLERPQRNLAIGDARNATSFAAEQRLEDDVSAQLLECMQSILDGLADIRDG